MNIGLGPGACEEREGERDIERDRQRELKRTEGGRMEEDNGFSPNKCIAQGTCGGGERRLKVRQTVTGKVDHAKTAEVGTEREQSSVKDSKGEGVASRFSRGEKKARKSKVIMARCTWYILARG